MIEYGACNLSVVPLRAEASDRSEILTQLLFGDCFEVLEITEKWVQVKTCFDDYQGWIDSKQFTPIKSCLMQPGEQSFMLGLKPYHEVVKVSTGEKLYLVAGSSVPKPLNGRFFLGTEEYQLPADSILAPGDFSAMVIDYARFYLQAPYLWGGRTLFGIDCSGLTQIVFKMLGKTLKRDAWQQAEQGEVVNFLQEAKPGDLAFFDNAEGRVIHVGIMLDEQNIIHASGRVKIDPIDGQGIYSLDLKRHTHKLRIIKRI
ncbi:C40 family peptidase [Paradesertivirga mongoliensis]|uniref:C40 family peptidase n=1 Tax=Paradesertivirga mongoliensis TaxID=2100740 RepID=A0ABW4ZQQ2_9SPHI|nr:C40 family peptidase [Pedobacter mongoliensis]